MGDICRIYNGESGSQIMAEVVGFKNDRILLMPYASMSGISAGNFVRNTGRRLSLSMGPFLKGRVINALGQPIDGKGPFSGGTPFCVEKEQYINPMTRPPIRERLEFGVKAIDGMLTIGKGQRIGIFAGSGVGKSTLMGMIAKNVKADINVIALVGERGREVVEFMEKDLGPDGMSRSVLVVATSDQPAMLRKRCPSVATGIAEYFRDMGYAVAVIADSTSRWAEALREMSGRLEEMPGEEGYPAYLASRIAQFYERAGCIRCIGSEGDRRGSVTAIGAVSPPGGDISEPVSQATMRIVKVFWALDSSLAYARHFPAINWLTSYSLYVDSLKPWYEATFGEEYMANRDKAMSILQQESELQEIVRLVGQDALSPADRLTMETAKMIREDFLQQNAFVDIDSYSEYRRQFLLLGLILHYDAECRDALGKNAPMHKLFAIPARVDIGRAKSVPSDEYEQVYAKIAADMTAQIKEIIAGGEEQ